MEMNLADGLNCIIGARGTGKTTALEFIRYALDAMPADMNARRRIESLIEKNLAGGRVEVAIQTRDGLDYIVSRAAGEAPMVLTAEGKPTEITLAAGGLFKADIYSQNEVEFIADATLSQLDLIDSFEGDRIAEISQRIRNVVALLTSNAGHIEPLQEKRAVLREELSALPAIQDRLKAYSAQGGDNAEELNRAHALRALRDRETRALQAMTGSLGELANEIAGLRERLAVQAGLSLDEGVTKGPNSRIMVGILDTFRACCDGVGKMASEALACIEHGQEEISAKAKQLHAAHQEQEIEFRKLIERHKEVQGRETERAQLERRRNELLAKQHALVEIDEQLQALARERDEASARLSELRDERFRVRQEIVQRINAGLGPIIRVSIEQYGNTCQYQELLEEALRRAGIKHGLVARKVASALSPAALAEIIKQKNVDALVKTAELNPEQARKVADTLAVSTLLFRLETVELADLPRIELKDGETYKDTMSLSTGQKCTTMLPILLLDTEAPLLVDQPEDNLDNRFVYETVVDSIRKVKPRRQLVFITHNPNIPVLGDAEKVIVLDSDGANGRKTNEGTVDECKDDIVTLLEGGEEAFKRRKDRYSY
jgi:DNA repair exonuclease SbcCD ATPase subunit